MLEKRISELAELINRKYTLEKRISDIGEKYSFLKEKIRNLSYLLDQRNIDCEALHEMPTVSLLYEVFISEGQKFSKAEYEYKCCLNLYDYITKEMQELKSRRDKISDYENEHREKLLLKEELALESENKSENNKEIIKYKNRLRDINEALKTANYLDDLLETVLGMMAKVKNWDNIDIFGRGIFWSFLKTGMFSDTDEKIKKFHYMTNRLIREIEIVNFYMNLNIDMRKMIYYQSYLEAGLYDDIKDKKRIKNIIENINDVHGSVKLLEDSLQNIKKEYLKTLLEMSNNYVTNNEN